MKIRVVARVVYPPHNICCATFYKKLGILPMGTGFSTGIKHAEVIFLTTQVSHISRHACRKVFAIQIIKPIMESPANAMRIINYFFTARLKYFMQLVLCNKL